MKSDPRLDVLFAKWRHGRIKLWDYTPSLCRMTFRIESPSVPGNLHLVCGGCVFMCGPLKWNDCDLRIDVFPDNDDGEIVVLKDTANGFELRCRIVSAAENVEPVYQSNLEQVNKD